MSADFRVPLKSCQISLKQPEQHKLNVLKKSWYLMVKYVIDCAAISRHNALKWGEEITAWEAMRAEDDRKLFKSRFKILPLT